MSVIEVEVDDSDIRLTTDTSLLKNKSFAVLRGLRLSEGSYFCNRSTTNAWLLRFLLTGKDLDFVGDSREQLGTLANRVVTPRVTLTEDGKHLLIEAPESPVYQDIIRQLAAYPTKGKHKAQVGKIFDLVALNETIPFPLPKFKLSGDARSVLSQPIPGFDGTVASLKNIPVDELFIVQADNQGWKQRKKDSKTMAEKLVSFKIATLYDLITHLPRRYLDRTAKNETENLVSGDTVFIQGTVESCSQLPRNMGVKFGIRTDSGQRKQVTFWRQHWLEKQYPLGSEVLINGKIGFYGRTMQISGSSIESARGAELLPVLPIYNQSQSKGITTGFLVSLMREMFSRLGEIKLPPYLEGVDEDRVSYYEAFKEFHLPTTLEHREKVVSALAYYELVGMQILIQEAKESVDSRGGLAQDGALLDTQAQAIAALPFEMTGAQQRAVAEINAKLAAESPSSTLLNADVGAGKGLLEDEKILTPNGYRTMRDIAVGDEVIGSDGTATTVIGVFPQGEQEVAEITFDDGSTIITDLAHRWTVTPRQMKQHVLGFTESRVMSTGDLLDDHDGNTSTAAEARWFIPVLSSPVVFDQHCPHGCADSANSENNAIELGASFEDLDHLPEWIFTASVTDRVAFVQSVVDEIGEYHGDVGVVLPVGASDVLVGVREIVLSLGGLSYISPEGLVIKLPPGIHPARTTYIPMRHRQITDSVEFRRGIVSIRRLDEKMRTICIKVDSDDELFVARDCIVTHNTLVAQLSCLRAVDSGSQAVLMAPTEVLARQLYETFRRIVDDLNSKGNTINLAYLGGKAAEKRGVIKGAKDGSIDIIVGTHSALFLEYSNLGFVCVDEQQKFGAEQRSQLLKARSDGLVPDYLMQSATPIPRSTAQVFYGDVDMILLDEKPPGRLPIDTTWLQESPEDVLSDPHHGVWVDVRSEAEKGNQTFVVAALVEESTTVDAASVKETHKRLSSPAFGFRVGMVHGTMKRAEQHEIMDKFRNKEFDVLVASTVVEVGVDIPDATRVVILSAERIGASSLHQTRGRVGRNDKPSRCVLVSAADTDNSARRLQALVDHADGFEVAKADLNNRGEGTIFNANQSGASEMLFASLRRHADKIPEAKAEALSILAGPHRELAISESRERFGAEEERLL